MRVQGYDFNEPLSQNEIREVGLLVWGCRSSIGIVV